MYECYYYTQPFKETLIVQLKKATVLGTYIILADKFMQYTI